MSRERRIRQFAKGFFWEEILKKQFSTMNIVFEEIVLIEELIPFEFYVGFVRIKSQSEKDEFIEVCVSFNKNGLPYITCNSTIVYSIEEHLEGGKVLLDKLNR